MHRRSAPAWLARSPAVATARADRRFAADNEIEIQRSPSTQLPVEM